MFWKSFSNYQCVWLLEAIHSKRDLLTFFYAKNDCHNSLLLNHRNIVIKIENEI